MPKPEDALLEAQTEGRIARTWHTLDTTEKRLVPGSLTAGIVGGYVVVLCLRTQNADHEPTIDASFSTAVEDAESNLDILDQFYTAIVIRNDPSYIKTLTFDGKDHSYVFPTLEEAAANRELNDQFVAAQSDPVLKPYILRIQNAETPDAAVEVLIDAESAVQQELYEATASEGNAWTKAESDGVPSAQVGLGVFAVVVAAGAAIIAGRRYRRYHREKKWINRGIDELIKVSNDPGGPGDAEPGQSTEKS